MKRIPLNVVVALVCVAFLLLVGGASAQVNCSGVPAWAPNTVYATGALVTYNGTEYKCIQAHTSEVGWEPSNVPALWGAVGACGTVTPMPTPTPKTTPTPTPTPKITPTPTPICGEPAWNANTSYAKGAAVGYNGTAWTALVANKGVTPGTNNSIWAALARPCPTQPPPTATPTPTPKIKPTPTPQSKFYSATDVGTYGLTANSYGVNDAGHVVGVSAVPVPTAVGTGVPGATPTPQGSPLPPRAFLSIAGKLTNPCGITDVGVEGASAINLSDVVFGECAGAPFSSYPGLSFSTPAGRGAILAASSIEVGWAQTATGDIHAYSWSGGVATDLGTLGGNWSNATGVSNQNEIVGASITTNNSTVYHGFTWFNGTLTDLGANTYAWGINNSSMVVGFSGQHAFLYENDVFTDLGTLAGGTSVAYAINDSNQIVGASDGHAFLYQNGVMTDLNTLVSPALPSNLYQARAIARIGYIVADAENGHSYLLKPPSTVPLWQLNVSYTAGQQVYFGGHIYQCVQAHTSQVTEEPPDVPALWRLIS